MIKIVDNSPNPKLPEPNTQEKIQSNKLVAEVIDYIKKNNNWMSFSDYMNYALYHPEYGYYTSGNKKIGPDGDFITAPELGPLFAYGLSRQISPIIKNHQDFNILEFGAGTGQLAIDILLELDKLNTLPRNYYILEVSADLKYRQQQNINKLPAELKDKIKWLDTLPDDNSFEGIILANEVIDAIPVSLFQYDNNNLSELGISIINNNIVWANSKTSPGIQDYIENNITDIDKNNYISEVNLFARQWLESVSRCLAQGLFIIIDYGFPRHEYYHPDRNQGTLMCHYKHHALQDPLFYPGLQDITSHVDFTSLAEVAVDNDLEVAGFLNQASFLLANHIIEYVDFNKTDTNIFKLKQQFKKLTSPSEMGELFKVLLLNKNLNINYFDNIAMFDKRGFL